MTLLVTAMLTLAPTVAAAAPAPTPGSETARTARQQTLILIDATGQSTVLELQLRCLPLDRQLRIVSAFNRSTFVAKLFPSSDCSGASSTISPGQRARYAPPFPIASVGALPA